MEIIKKKIARPGVGLTKNAHKIPTKREFATIYRSAEYSGKTKTWYLDEADYLKYMKKPVKGFKVECRGIAL